MAAGTKSCTIETDPCQYREHPGLWDALLQRLADFIPSWNPSMGLPGLECNGKLTKQSDKCRCKPRLPEITTRAAKNLTRHPDCSIQGDRLKRFHL